MNGVKIYALGIQQQVHQDILILDVYTKFRKIKNRHICISVILFSNKYL